MRITILAKDKAIPFSDVLNITLRYDLLPIPLSVEFSVKSTDEYIQLLKDGAEILIGDLDRPLKIIKTQQVYTQTIKNGHRIGAIACVAIISGMEKLIKSLNKAVILYESSFNNAIRACGCTISFGLDTPLQRFICLKGTIPTFRIANYLQQEACVIGFIQNKLSILKIDHLFKQNIKLVLDPSAITWLNSESLESMKKSSYVSVSQDGSTVIGADDTKSNHNIIQKGNLSLRELKNLEKVLVTRGVVMRPLDLNLMAGDLVKIDQKNYVILTAVHYFNTGSLDSDSATVTKLWIASL